MIVAALATTLVLTGAATNVIDGVMLARDRLRTWMEERDLSQQQAAEQLGCSQSMVSAVLTGHRTPDLELAFAIQRATEGWESGAIAASSWLSNVETAPAAGEGR